MDHISDLYCTVLLLFHLEVFQVLLRDDGGLAQLAEEADPHVALQAAFVRGSAKKLSPNSC